MQDTPRLALVRPERAGWREPVVAASLIGCPLAAVLYLSCHHGVAVPVVVRALGAICALNLLPGYLIQRFVFRLRPHDPFETLLSSLLLGVMLVPAMWYALCWLAARPMPVSTAVAVAAAACLSYPCLRRWRRRRAERSLVPDDSRGDRDRRTPADGDAAAAHRPARPTHRTFHATPGTTRWVEPADTLVLWLALLLMILWSYETTLVEVRDGQAYTIPFHDLLMPAALVGECARGVPIEAVPFVAKVRGFSYHYMSMVWCDLIRRAAGTDAMTAYFHLALPLRYVFMALAGYLMLRGRFGRPAALAGVACMLAVVEPVRWFLPGGVLILIHYGYTASFGLVGSFLCIYYLATARPGQYRGPLLLASILSGLLLCYKANFALVLIPAVALYAGVMLLKRRDCGWLVVCAAAQAAIVGVRALLISSAEMRHALVMAPLAYLRWEWAGLMLPAAAKAALHDAVAILPALLRWPVIFAVWTVYRWHVGIVVLLYLVLRCGFGRSSQSGGGQPRRFTGGDSLGAGTHGTRDRFDRNDTTGPVHAHRARGAFLPPGRQRRGLDRAILLVLACCALGFLLLPVQKGCVWNVAQHLRVLVHALLFALMGPALCAVAWRLKHGGATTGRRLRTAGTVTVVRVLVAAVLVGDVLVLRHKALDETRFPTYLASRGEYACYRYVASSTPPDSVVLHRSRYATGRAVSALTQRRMVLDIPEPWTVMLDVEPIAADVARFYAGAPSGEARAILDRYDVDYVVADGARSHVPAGTGWLVPVFRDGLATVYRVVRDRASAPGRAAVVDALKRVKYGKDVEHVD